MRSLVCISLQFYVLKKITMRVLKIYFGSAPTSQQISQPYWLCLPKSSIFLLLIYLSLGFFCQTSFATSPIVFDQVSCDNVINGGIIEADEFGCPNPIWDPSPITNVDLPEGGTGTLEYIWIFTTDDPALPSSFWNPLPGSNGPDYDPGPISVTTYFRRCARRSGCTDYIGETNIIMKEAICCDNITNGGKIEDSQVLCNPPYLADSLVNLALPTGGSNEIEYQWIMSSTGSPYSPTNTDWTEITGANGEGYNPGTITQTTYFIRLSRRHGCYDYDGVSNMVSIIFSSEIVATLIGSDETCMGAGDGVIEITNISGGSPGYTIEWVGIPGETDSILTNQLPGDYEAIITDTIGCSDTTSITLNDGPPLNITAVSTDISCIGEIDGTAEVTQVENGILPFAYLWDDPASQTDSLVNNLSPGTYQVVVTDGQGCIGTGSVQVNDAVPLELTVSSSDATCDDSDDGSATAQVSGGAPPYSYLWNDPLAQTTESAVGLSLGTYSVIVTDDHGCTSELSVDVGAPMQDEININSTDVSCFAGSDGTADVSIVNGNVSDFSFLWSNNSTEVSILDLKAGQYLVTVTNSNGCTSIDSVLISEPTALDLVMDSDSASCYNSSDGTAIVMASGGTPFPNDVYLYSWNAPGNPAVQMLDDVSPGIFTVTVTDANGCAEMASVEIGAPSEIQITLNSTNVTCNGFADGTATAQVQGGNPPYSFEWNDANNTSTGSIADLAQGTYSLTVSDANNCVATTILNITEPLPLALDFNNSNVVCVVDTNGVALAAPSGGTSPYSYLWEIGETTQAIFDLGIGNYGITLTDANGCLVVGSTEIEATTTLASSVTTFDATCFETNNGVAIAQGIDGTQPYSYAWSNGANTAQVNDLFFGSYGVTVTDGDGCFVTNTAVVNVPPQLIAAIQILSEVTTYGGNDGSVVVSPSGGIAPYSIEWEDGSTTDTLTNIEGGTHNVTITDSNGCTGVGQINLIEPSKIGDYVWNDENQNGIQNTGEHGIEGVPVLLTGITNSGDTIGLTTLTDTVGFYAFDGLEKGIYKVQFGNLPNHVFTHQNIGNDGLDSDADQNTGETQNIFLTQSEYEDRWDCGLIFLDEKIDIGDKVWYDTNHDGIQGLNEAGVQNVIVRLREMPANNIIDVQVTNVVGFYLFEDVYPGDYKVEFALASFPAGGYILSPKDQGTDDNKDSDPEELTGVTDQITVFPFTLDNLTIDAGIFKECDNITDGGLIGFDEDLCGFGSNPDEIVDVISPSGGFGVIEYVWLKSAIPVYNGQGDSNWSMIPNSNSASYDPGPISISTYYIRCARRQGCDDFIGESNVVAKKITSYPLTQIIDQPITLCKNEEGRFEAAIAGAGATYFWEFDDGGSPATATTRVVNAVSWPDPGGKNITLTVTRFGCSLSTSTDVFIDNCGSNPLITFDDLFGEIEEEEIQLDWKVTGNTAYTVFYVERSENGQNFQTIGNIMGMKDVANSTYSFTDEQPRFGENIYRIRYDKLDTPQESGLSENVMVMFQREATVLAQVFPNPTKGRVTIELLIPGDEPAIGEIVNPYGMTVHTFEIPANTEKFDIDLGEYYEGLYLMRIQQPKLKTQIFKIFKVD